MSLKIDGFLARQCTGFGDDFKAYVQEVDGQIQIIDTYLVNLQTFREAKQSSRPLTPTFASLLAKSYLEALDVVQELSLSLSPRVYGMIETRKRTVTQITSFKDRGVYFEQLSDQISRIQKLSIALREKRESFKTALTEEHLEGGPIKKWVKSFFAGHSAYDQVVFAANAVLEADETLVLEDEPESVHSTDPNGEKTAAHVALQPDPLSNGQKASEQTALSAMAGTPAVSSPFQGRVDVPGEQLTPPRADKTPRTTQESHNGQRANEQSALSAMTGTPAVYAFPTGGGAAQAERPTPPEFPDPNPSTVSPVHREAAEELVEGSS